MNPLLEQLSASVSADQTVEGLTRPLLEMLEAVTGMESTYLTSVDEERGLQQVLYARNSRSMQIPEGLAVPWNDTLCKRALDEGRSFTDDVPACWGDSQAARDLGIRTYASMPVRTGDGALYGTLCAVSTQSRPSTPEAERILSLFAYLIGQQVERERLIGELLAANERLARHAATDQLTGLPNRRALMEALARLLAQGRRRQMGVLIAFIDLDGFKSVNDVHGHDVGDQFLVAIAERLQAALRAEDMAARLGGDEFVVVSFNAHAGGAARTAQDTLQQRIAQATQGRFELPGASLDYAGASVGVVTVPPDSRHTAEDALRLADQSMYQVKVARQQQARLALPRP
ncbi:sensor domain-containing diguanylate cyclase [Acidovorax sp. NCPPB 4044]|uniref:sensor domain-containing diguanylate cyclase n=1 Tax=Acidovorax sp. NCPPB 4044 TaxID=2940490 RepID=UPI002303AD0E|nr:sensor domain-containing diguanylate cyclase [Acidovorax sp. NCPPB 4044]MDA8523221.1 sensor domain-containing diguanylate cyclase [Acidovorax sp. NCPPB 4044]